jgi:hypothetical protein
MDFLSELKRRNIIRMPGLYSFAYVGVPLGTTYLVEIVAPEGAPATGIFL